MDYACSVLGSGRKILCSILLCRLDEYQLGGYQLGKYQSGGYRSEEYRLEVYRPDEYYYVVDCEYENECYNYGRDINTMMAGTMITVTETLRVVGND